jgi:hypothetical protein
MDPNAATHTFDKTIRDKQESSDRTEQSKKKGRIAHVTGTGVHRRPWLNVPGRGCLFWPWLFVPFC